MTRWIRFVELERKAKTIVWAVLSLADAVGLGVVQWHGPWRRYCFFPGKETLFDPQCLRDIADFCQAKTKEHRDGGGQP